jgi:hypothetical protein
MMKPANSCAVPNASEIMVSAIIARIVPGTINDRIAVAVANGSLNAKSAD